MSRHVGDVDLASYVGGDVNPRKAARIGTHLAGCAQCGDRVHQLQSMPNLLSSVQYPPIPANLSNRIDLAIASESAARVSSLPVSEASRGDLPARARPVRARPARRGWRMPGLSSPRALRTLAAVGAAVIVAGGGYELATHGASSGPSSTSGQESINGPAAVAGGEVQVGQKISYRHDGHTDSVTVVQSGTDFAPATLRKQAGDAIAAQRSAAGSPRTVHTGTSSPLMGEAPTVGTFGNLAPVPNADVLRGCVGRISAGRDVLLVDVARYLGKRATIIVVSEPSHVEEVFAVSPSCSASTSDILARQDLLRP
jgi:hypothetical protein